MGTPDVTAAYIGEQQMKRNHTGVDGAFVHLQGGNYYRIRNYDLMQPFLMSVVSSSDHWMFLSSSGGITAGRRCADAALFPYYSDDRIAENNENTGSLTIIRANAGNGDRVWEPFSSRCAGIYDTTRSLYKNVLGTSVIFEEVNRDLGLTFRYGWTTSDRFGFVRTSEIINDSRHGMKVEILDGFLNVLPFGVMAATQSRMSNLLDAYKRAELDSETGVAIYSMSSTLTDLAEPSESLLATRVFHCELTRPVILLSATQVSAFRNGDRVAEERDIRGVRGAYLVSDSVELEAGGERTRKLVADVEQDARHIVSVINLIKQGGGQVSAAVDSDVESSDRALRQIIAGADGLQSTGDHLASVHHFSNVLFNTMRGGTFPNGYTVERSDLIDFFTVRNRDALESAHNFLEALPETMTREELVTRAAGTGNPDVERLCTEYLPLAFSRRHGDPSRPWNVFSINLRNPDGSRKYDYQGNWRDIFQNWEALAWSFPHYLEGMVFRFANATTADGYNPYRLTRAGFEWEVPDPDNPWANIGYWGDHQIIYLQKLLETLERFSPGRLSTLLSRNVFSYANVPYCIRKYEEILDNWYDTIIFDEALHQRIEDAVDECGTDARLLSDKQGNVVHVSFAEKLLVLLLVKLANLVPEGGIWMNTQRPEWNDANNALVGKGLSVVTTGYLRRFVHFLRSSLASFEDPKVVVSAEVASLFHDVRSTLTEHASILETGVSNAQRRAMMDALGNAASAHRWQIYANGLAGEFVDISTDELGSFLDLAQRHIDHTLEANERSDGLYHAYNTLNLVDGQAGVEHLYEMLEGQVSVLSSGLLSAGQSRHLLVSLRKSRLYRADQHSYILYPDRELPGFMQKNTLPRERAERLELVKALVRDRDESLVVRDENGDYHFNGRFRNRKGVDAALSSLRTRYPDLVENEGEQVQALFESVFDHNSFTGRSGTFFAYEGLGSIYWHMVSKLLLAVQEIIAQAVDDGEDSGVIDALREHYYDIRMGLGFNKAPDVYGAFPTDPYSHTPNGRGAQQPGMTGQVKEEVLTRPAELGVRVRDGSIEFNPFLLRQIEFLEEPITFSYVAPDGSEAGIDVPAGAFVFTLCQVPIVVRRSARSRMIVTLASGEQSVIHGHRLDPETSARIFARDGSVRALAVEMDTAHA